MNPMYSTSICNEKQQEEIYEAIEESRMKGWRGWKIITGQNFVAMNPN